MSLAYKKLREVGRSSVYTPMAAQHGFGRVAESGAQSSGIYYAIYSPRGWNLFSYRFDEFPDIDHSEFWEQHVAPVLAFQWATKLKKRAKELEHLLVNSPYGFPRGRISNRCIYHGGDLPSQISKSSVERAFGLGANTRWEIDSHESCSVADAHTVTAVLHIKQTWPAK